MGKNKKNYERDSSDPFESFKFTKLNFKKWTLTDSLRSMMINEGLHEIFMGESIISKNDGIGHVSKLIEDYDYQDEWLKNVYDRVMDSLEVSNEKRMRDFSFENDIFAKNLFLLMWKRRNFPNSFPFDLSRLFFKWMIHMKEDSAIDGNDFKFKELTKTLYDMNKSIWTKKFPRAGISFNFEFESKDFKLESKDFKFDNQFLMLLKIEYLEHEFIFPFFQSILKYFYLDKKDKLMKEEGEGRINCRELRIKYFNGNYDTDILLKYLILIFDPYGELRKCILIKNPHLKDFQSVHYTIDEMEKVSKDFNWIKLKILENTGNIRAAYANKPIIESFLLSNQNFIVYVCEELIHLLRQLNNLNLLTRANIEKLVSFSLNDPILGNVIKWNRRHFDFLLNDFKILYFTWEEEYKECNKYSLILNNL